MNEPEVFVLAARQLAAGVAQIADEQWATPLPARLARAGSDQLPTLRQVIDYHAYDDAWVPDMLAGRTMDGAGREKFDGDLLGDDPRGSFARIAETACAAAAESRDLEATVHCSFGDFTVAEYFWQINSFRGLAAHDFALAIGVEPDLPEALVQGLWDEISPHAEEWRSLGVFPAAVAVPAEAPLQERLLGLTGRNP
jgi:uncharacterized protein (TIGR03086 family)